MSLNGNAEGKRLRGSISRLMELRGYSAYEVAVIKGFKGTEEEWLDYMRNGVDGKDGNPVFTLEVARCPKATMYR